jgi:hypothetical protein
LSTTKKQRKLWLKRWGRDAGRIYFLLLANVELNKIKFIRKEAINERWQSKRRRADGQFIYYLY